MASCGGENTNTDSNVQTSGAPASAKTKALETGAALLQDKAPIGALNAYMNGFHFYNGKPEGTPMLMMGFTADGQADPTVVQARDARFKISTEENRKNRADIEYPTIDPDADAWQKGVVLQVGVK